MQKAPTILIHGGAWAMPDSAIAAHERGIHNALQAGWKALSRGGSAVDAVVDAVASMEDDDTFDAGRGSFLTRDGRVQMDALLMQGRDLRTGGVACVERLQNPIRAARLVLDQSPHVYFVGPGAEAFAQSHDMPLIPNGDLIVPRERDRLARFLEAEQRGATDTTFSGDANSAASTGATPSAAALAEETRTVPTEQGTRLTIDHAIESAADFLPASDPVLNSHDTVGAVALDSRGNLAAGTSTGGTLAKAPGRVGDSSLIGCGCYADDLSAAVSLTGWGEPIMKLVLGKRAVDRVAAGDTPQAAATEAIHYLHTRLGGFGGIILLGPDGQIGLAHNTPRMAWGLATPTGLSLGTTRNA